MRAPLLLPALFASALLSGEAAGSAETCATCDPARLLAQAREALEQARRWHIPEGGSLSPVPPLLAAEERAQAGLAGDALGLGRAAASRCLLQGAEGCAETFALLAELTLATRAGTAGAADEALAYLSLLPYEDLSGALCVRAATLRFRLSEQHGVGRARPSWADRCGGLGQAGEVGYRAAKAALVQGALDDAERRLEEVRAAGGLFAVRSLYLLAALHVARGELTAAERAFREVMELPPAAHRSEEEDDARALAALQLARLARERGDLAGARELYQAVPAGSLGRKEALLEVAVVSAHLGDLGAARAYLDALEAYAPDLGDQLEVRRLRANLAVVDGDEEEALATFRELTVVGRRAREALTSAGSALEARLREDPSLGGLLDPEAARALIAVEDDLAAAEALLDESAARARAIEASLREGGPDGPAKRALEQLEGADALLLRAERLLVVREVRGQRLAGPAQAALALARDARALRAELDREMARALAHRAAERSALERELSRAQRELDSASVAFRALVEGTRDDLAQLRRHLYERAERVVERLEMSEDIGELELAARRKRRATLEVERVRREYDQSMATLVSDVGEGKDAVGR